MLLGAVGQPLDNGKNLMWRCETILCETVSVSIPIIMRRHQCFEYQVVRSASQRAHVHRLFAFSIGCDMLSNHASRASVDGQLLAARTYWAGDLYPLKGCRLARPWFEDSTQLGNQRDLNCYSRGPSTPSNAARDSKTSKDQLRKKESSQLRLERQE